MSVNKLEIIKQVFMSVNKLKIKESKRANEWRECVFYEDLPSLITIILKVRFRRNEWSRFP